MIKWDRIGLRKVNDAVAQALELTAEVLQDEVREEMVVPRDTGLLQGEAFFIDRSRSKRGVVRLIFDTPYARRLYYHPEYNFHKDKNVNAQGLWMRHWLPGGKYQYRVSEIFGKILERLT